MYYLQGGLTIHTMLMAAVKSTLPVWKDHIFSSAHIWVLCFDSVAAFAYGHAGRYPLSFPPAVRYAQSQDMP